MGEAENLYDSVLSDEDKKRLAEQAQQQVDEVDASLVREHYEISRRVVQTDADKARLTEIDGILTERKAARQGGATTPATDTTADGRTE